MLYLRTLAKTKITPILFSVYFTTTVGKSYSLSLSPMISLSFSCSQFPSSNYYNGNHMNAVLNPSKSQPGNPIRLQALTFRTKKSTKITKPIQKINLNKNIYRLHPKNQVIVLGFVKKYGRPRLPTNGKVENLHLVKQNGRLITTDELELVKNSGRIEIFDSSDKNGRLAIRVDVNREDFVEIDGGSETVDLVQGKGGLSNKDEGQIFDLVELNGGKPIKEQGKVSYYHEKYGNLPVKEVESSGFVQICGELLAKEVENINFIKENGRVPCEEQVEVIDSVGKFSGLPTNDVESLDLLKMNGELQVLDSVERIGKSPSGERFGTLDLFKKSGKSVTILDFNDLLMGLIKADEHDSAAKLFYELPCHALSPDSWTYSIMVQCFCEKNELDEAKWVLDSMIENGFPPNIITFTNLINCFCKKGKLKKAYEVFEIMDQIGCEPTIRTYNCLINGLCFVGRVEEAFELLTKIKKSSLLPDIYTYTTVMDGFCKVGRSDEGMELLEEAMIMGLNPTAVTFNTMFNGYCKEGRPLEGINLLKQMVERDCQPDLISYTTLLHGLLKWNEISAALPVYKEMLQIGFEVDERIMNKLLNGICKKSLADDNLLHDAEELFDKIKQLVHVVSPYTYRLMIQALLMGRKTSKALATLQEMVRTGYSPRTMTCDAVIRGLCNEGRVEEASAVLVLMIKGRTLPSRISSSILVDEFSKRGRFLDARKVYAFVLKQGVVPYQKPRERFED